MSQPYDLTQLDAGSFEHMVNFLAMKKLGPGVTGLAAGPDGGRDGLLKGKASYPTEGENWEGLWYIQSKFHKPSLSKDEQKWLISQVKNEIKEFQDLHKRRTPDIWIIATNIDASGHHQTGSYDAITELVKSAFPNMKVDIWGGRRILDFLMEYSDVAKTYGHFLTSGHVITKLYEELEKRNKTTKELVNYLIAQQFKELCNTKLEQAGATGDQRQKIYELFRDLPINSATSPNPYYVIDSLVSASKNVQKLSTWNNFGSGWREWSVLPNRARIMLLKGGPGQGKSTAGQYFSQIQKAAFILSDHGPKVSPPVEELAEELKIHANNAGHWPKVPRIPVFVELKDYAKWYINQSEHQPRNIIEYVHGKIKSRTSFDSTPSMLRDALTTHAWFINFDGLDEVPNDIKDEISSEIIEFSEETTAMLDSDVLILCTTRPQGYSGQFDSLSASVCELLPLSPEIALECAAAVVKYNRSEDEYEESLQTLRYAMQSEQVRHLMTTPLQSHIMAVVVRDGGRPPERRWELFNNFYNVMKRRESQKNFLDKNITSLLQENDQLLKAIHDRLGISLHAKAELSSGAESALLKDDFKKLSEQTASLYLDGDTSGIVNTLMEATIERLVFVNTPESSFQVRFDVRQLQEFFAGEFIHSAVDDKEFKRRFELICGDAHWREVVHFILSALSQQKKLSTIDIASNIMQRLDNDNESHKVKSFKRRLGIGCLLTLRLLEEGVLEQDKGIRYQFNNCLHPLWNIVELPVIDRVLSIKKEQSLNWLLNNLVETFISFDFSEHIVAGYYLALMLNDDHVRYNEVFSKIITAPEYYWLSIYSLFDKSSFTGNANSITPMKWFLKLSLRFYLEQKDFSSEVYIKLFFFLRTSLGRSHSILNDECFNDDELLIITNLFPLDRVTSHLDKSYDYIASEIESESIKEHKYCFVSEVMGESTWIEPYDYDMYNHVFSERVYSLPVELFKAAYVFCGSYTEKSFRKLLSLIKLNDHNTIYITEELRSLIPIRFEGEFIESYLSQLLALDDLELETYLVKKELNGTPLFLECNHLTLNSTEFEADKWAALCIDYPQSALRIPLSNFFNRQSVHDAINIHATDFYAPLLKIALERPDIFAKSFFVWGDIFRVYPEHEEHIKSKLINQVPPKGIGAFQPASDNYHFIINKDHELSFIVYFAAALLIDPNSSEFGFIDPNTVIGANYDEHYLLKFGLSNVDMLNIILNSSNCIEVRSSTLSLYMSQSFKNKGDAVEQFFEHGLDDVLISLYNDSNSKLISIGVYMFLRNINHFDARLVDFLGGYTNLCKDNFYSRFLIQAIYSNWRERSSAVVQNANVLESWLEYSYSTR